MYNNLINFSFKKILLLSSIAFGCFVSAQTPALEFAAGAGNPAGNGPTIANQVITFQNNTDNPTGNTFTSFTPVTTATFSLTNQQRTMTPSPGVGVMFGGNVVSSGSATPAASALFPLINSIGSPSNANFTSINSTAGTGIDVAANRNVGIYVTVRPLYESNAPLPTSSTRVRYEFSDMVVTFSRPVTNPIFHFSACGANSKGSAGNPMLYSTEFELITSGTSLTRLSGSTEFTVPSATSIINGASQYDVTTGNGAMSGSVRVNGTNLTQVSFKIYLSAMDNSSVAGNPSDWNIGLGTSSNSGDAFTVGVSLSPCDAGTTAPSLSATTLSNTCPASTANLNSLHTGTVPSGASLVWFTNNTHSGSVYATPTAATAGTYYAYYYDSSNNCYSPASSAVTVTITPCCAAGTTGPAIN